MIPDNFRLSVIMPVYNERKTVLRVLDRVLSVPIDKEVIIVDNFSTDGTRELLESGSAGRCEAAWGAWAPPGGGPGGCPPRSRLRQHTPSGRLVAPTGAASRTWPSCCSPTSLVLNGGPRRAPLVLRKCSDRLLCHLGRLENVRHVPDLFHEPVSQ